MDRDRFPPKPYARICPAGSHDRYYNLINVPLGWLKDWRSVCAVEPRTDIRYGSERFCRRPTKPPFPTQYLCFYSPVSVDVRPIFKGIRHLSGADAETAIPSGENFLIDVNVIEVVWSEKDNVIEHSDVDHADVQLVGDGTQLTVPLTWIRDWKRLLSGPDGRPSEPKRSWWCYYDPDARSDEATTEVCPCLVAFRPTECAWYEVRVLQTFEGE